MLEFKQDETAVQMIMTLTELSSLADPFFLFVFTHVATKEIVAFVRAAADDESDYPFRYNQFTIDVSDLFSGRPVGEWHYKVFEQDNDTNLDPPADTLPLESGKMRLDRDIDFAFQEYNSPTTYTVYNG